MRSMIRNIDARIKLAALVVYFLVAFHASGPVGLGIVALIAVVLAGGAGITPVQAAKVMVPLAFVLVVTCLLQMMTWQEGNPLGSIGPWLITDQGIARALRMVVVQASVVLASMAFMRYTDAVQLVHAVEQLLYPLKRRGVNVDAFILSITVAMNFVPVLVKEFFVLRSAHAVRGVSFEGPIRERLRSNTRLVAPLLRSSFRHADNLAESFLARCFGLSQ